MLFVIMSLLFFWEARRRFCHGHLFSFCKRCCAKTRKTDDWPLGFKFDEFFQKTIYQTSQIWIKRVSSFYRKIQHWLGQTTVHSRWEIKPRFIWLYCHPPQMPSGIDLSKSGWSSSAVTLLFLVAHSGQKIRFRSGFRIFKKSSSPMSIGRLTRKSGWNLKKN